MKLAIHDISIIGVVDNENVRLRVEYTPDGGNTTVDYGKYSVAQNIYYPGLDEEHEEEYNELQRRVETRGM